MSDEEILKMNKRWLLDEIRIRLSNEERLKKENKQIKEELERSMKANIVLDNTNTDYASIIFELEEWLKEIMKIYEKDVFDIVSNAIYNQCEDTLDKIQELKEKYK